MILPRPIFHANICNTAHVSPPLIKDYQVVIILLSHLQPEKWSATSQINAVVSSNMSWAVHQYSHGT